MLGLQMDLANLTIGQDGRDSPDKQETEKGSVNVLLKKCPITTGGCGGRNVRRTSFGLRHGSDNFTEDGLGLQRGGVEMSAAGTRSNTAAMACMA